MNNHCQYQFFFPNLMLLLDWDLVEASEHLACSAPNKQFVFEHIKGHQDELLLVQQFS